ncbi:MAG: serine/threonine-protein kinase [Anaerolineae bacterium]|nr:serine/threonine protein kinase [Anaerolineae bacterium]MDW8298610.1 serine/threonine-protein kinase [Anaerolineae bacterium]
MKTRLTGTQLGAFTVGELIGDGGMGSVYLATHPDYTEPMAIKVLLPQYAQDAEFRARFIREGQVLSEISHPHIIPVYHFGEDKGLLYFVMRYVKGKTLYDLLLSRRFTPIAAWQIIRPISEALDYAHERSIIHRDVKPANILIEVQHVNGKVHNQVFLADFGLSKVLSWTALTTTGVSVGTPQYMSPEQVMDYPLTPASDVYSLAVVVYEMLLGRLPFYAKRPEELAFRHIDTSPPAPSALNRDFPKPIEAVLMRALLKEPERRYQRAGDFAKAYAEAARQVGYERCAMQYYVGEPRHMH